MFVDLFNLFFFIFKINVLSFQNENLTNEKNELLNIVNKLNSEKSDLIEK